MADENLISVTSNENPPINLEIVSYKNEVGVTYIQGKGDKGDKGEKGDTGEKGDKGDIGINTMLVSSFTGAINGSNTTFVLNNHYDDVIVFINGIKYSSADYAYTKSTATVIFNFAIPSGYSLEFYGITNKNANVLPLEDLSAVAESGSYEDLTDKPQIPSKTSELTNDSNFISNTTIQTTAGQSWSTSNMPVAYTKNSDTYLVRGNMNKYKPKVIVFGSSVALGSGATNNQGWAYMLGQYLTTRGFEFKNYSIGGNTTQSLIDRFYTDITPEHPNFLVISLSLANEGIMGASPETVYTQYVNNMKKLIQMCKMSGITPVITNCYPNNDYTATHYRYIKQFNSELASWDVASVDFLGAVDDGTGKWLTGTYIDAGHPNDTGHEAMFRAICVSMFTNLLGFNDKEKHVKKDGFVTYANDSTVAPIKFTPTEQINSFSLGVTIKNNVAQVGKAFVGIGSGIARLRNPSNVYEYTNNASSATIASTINPADLQWHRIMLVYNNVAHTMSLYIDGTLIGSCAETMTPATMNFILAGRFDSNSANPTNASYKDLVVYRTCLTADKVLDDCKGKILNSSLELYSPLNDSITTANSRLINLAPTTSYAVVNSSTVTADKSLDYLSIKKKYSKPILFSWTTGLSSGTYYFGFSAVSLLSWLNSGLRMDSGGRIKRVQLDINVGATLGSAENCSLYLVINGATEHLLSSSVQFNTAAYIDVNTDIAVTATDYVNFKLVLPSMNTIPQGLTGTGAMLIEY